MTTLTIPVSPRLIYNRHVLVLKPKQPLVDWLTSIAASAPALTLEMAQQERNTYLIPPFDDDQDGERWVMRRWRSLFEMELGEKTTDPERWPELTPEVFKEFFDIEIQGTVFDMSDEAFDIGE